MLRLPLLAVLAAAAFALSACGGDSARTCSDANSMAARITAFQDAVKTAQAEGRIDAAKAAEIHEAYLKIGEGVREGNFAGICINLEAVRRKYGV
jgi:hypothetical protein